MSVWKSSHFPSGDQRGLYKVPLFLQLQHCPCAAIGPLCPEIDGAFRMGGRERHRLAVRFPRLLKVAFLSITSQLDAPPSIQPLDPDLRRLGVDAPGHCQPHPVG